MMTRKMNAYLLQVEFQTSTTSCLRASRGDSPSFLHSQKSDREVRVADNLWTFKLTLCIYRPIDGISTYNVVPFEAGAYFNKIQCFCFEEQRLNPGEEVDMPVFFYIDPDFEKDPFLQDTNEITLSYTFFESKPGLQLPTYNPSVMNK